MSITPEQTLLQSYNMLTLQDPNDILDNLGNHKAQELSPDLINVDTGIKNVKAKYQEETSVQSTREQFANSMGISADFVVFSGSVQNNFESDHSQKSTSFNASCSLKIDYGSTSISVTDSQSILNLMNSGFQEALHNIYDFDSAADFVSSYGTHLIAGVGLGGTMYIAIHADTTSVSDKKSVSTEVSAAYNGVENSVSSVVKAASTVQKEQSGSGLTQRAAAFGGDPRIVSSFVPEKITEWANTCDESSINGLTKSIPVWELANEDSKGILKDYIYYEMLKASIRKPRIFSEVAHIGQDMFSLSCTAQRGYKIVSGGASVTRNSHNYLMSSYPQLDSNDNIQSWEAISNTMHGDRKGGDEMTVYAIGIYDPQGFLDVSVATGSGGNPGRGEDGAEARLLTPYVLTGGGTHSVTYEGHNKYLTASYPLMETAGWMSIIHDYARPAEDVALTSYVIGITDTNNRLIIQNSCLESQSSSAQDHGNQTAQGQFNICGGGVQVDRRDGYGNIVQASNPVPNNAWHEYNKDLAGKHSHAISTAYALWLEVENR